MGLGSVSFQLEDSDGQARAGTIQTPHGDVPTPVFVPVATQGSVKAVSPDELQELGAGIVLGNTYHLYLRPGVELIREMGGLAAFMGWDGPTLTDSGGFQAYSLGSRVRVDDDGLMFRSVIDGGRHYFTPESAVAHQEAIGADIIMALDQCLTYTGDKEAVREAMERTHRWAVRSREAYQGDSQALFGIVQGGVFPDVRKESAEFITGLDFPGYAIGGMAVGETKAVMYPTVAQTASLLPEDRPRYLMGVGSPEDLVECVARGVDLFDCALPTRVARNGALFTRQGRVDITNRAFRGVHAQVEECCDCYTCSRFSAGYLHHLFRARELLGLRLASVHNLRFVTRLMEEMRASIREHRFSQYAEAFRELYRPANEALRLEQREKWLASRGV